MGLFKQYSIKDYVRATLFSAGLLLLLTGCANVGHEFPDHRVSELEMGETTQQDVRRIFGEPWRVGYEDGMRTWTYGKYHYTLLGSPTTKDLVIRFDKNNVVQSYTYNTTEHDE
jgi:outer membrane protein assembly factor BamE (lipoprotein component of BamABCDE complex)